MGPILLLYAPSKFKVHDVLIDLAHDETQYEATSRYLATPSPQGLDHPATHLEADAHVNKLSWASLLIAGGVAGVSK